MLIGIIWWAYPDWPLECNPRGFGECCPLCGTVWFQTGHLAAAQILVGSRLQILPRILSSFSAFFPSSKKKISEGEGGSGLICSKAEQTVSGPLLTAFSYRVGLQLAICSAWSIPNCSLASEAGVESGSCLFHRQQGKPKPPDNCKTHLSCWMC